MRTKKQIEKLTASNRREIRRTGKWGRFPGDCCLEMPLLRYSHEHDPKPDIITIDRRHKFKGKPHGRIIVSPRVRIAFPSERLRDGKASGDVLRLPKKWVQWVLDTEFAVPWKAIASVEYLLQLGRNLSGDPLLQGFDTLIRDGLHSVSIEAVFRGFWLLGDYRYDSKDPQGHKSESLDARSLWAHLAAYVFWAECGQVGAGLPFFFARLDETGAQWKGEHKKVVELLSLGPRIVRDKKA